MHGSERLLQLQKPGSNELKKIKLKIPKGVEEGQILSCGGLGGPGINGGKHGDLLLKVRLERHPVFQVDGSDLHMDVSVAPWECVLGSSVEVATLSGNVRLKVPQHSQNGDTMKLTGRGLPFAGNPDKSGDLYVHLEIAMPEEISTEEEEIWKSLAEASNFSPRK
jgi:curved DNA-binding protein